MINLKRSLGIVLLIAALLVAIHTVVEPLYHVSANDMPNSPFWYFVNPLAALSLILGLICSYMRLHRSSANASVQEFVAANTLFYAFVFVTIIFFWNWFGIINADEFTAVSDQTRSLVWIFVDALLPPLNIAMGLHLFRATKSN